MAISTKPTLFWSAGVYDANLLYSPVPSDGSGDLDFTRASIANRYNSSGLIEQVASGVPRITYKTGEVCPSLLTEDAATNLMTYSEQFDNVIWQKSNASVSPNLIASPDGTTTADKLIDDATTSVHRVFYSNFPSGTQRAFSVHAKKGEIEYLCLFENNSIAPIVNGVIFNLNNGTVQLNNAPSYYTSAGVIDCGDGWYRCYVVYTPTALSVPSISTSTLSTNSYLGDGVKGLYIWGAQLEAGSKPTSYIKTEALTVTRVAELVSKTGIQSLIGDSEGVLFFQASVPDVTGNYSVSIGDGTNNNRVQLDFLAGSFRMLVDVGGVSQVSSTASSYTANTVYKCAIKYSPNNFSLWVNGVEVATDVSGITFADAVLTGFYFGTPSGTQPFRGNSYTLALWDKALPNSEIAEIVTI